MIWKMGLEKVKEEVLRKAKERADAIFKEAKSEANSIEVQMQKRIAAEKERMLQETAVMMDDLSRQEVSQAKLDARNSMLKAKKELIEHVMSKARNKLEKLSQQDRRGIISSLLKRGQRDIRVRYVYCNKNDVQLVKKLGNFSFDNADISGGLILEIEDKTVRIDLSYESIMEKIREENLTKISDILFEKKEGEVKEHKKSRSPKKSKRFLSESRLKNKK